MLGFVQAGLQARADRYTYLALTGVALALALPVAAWATPRPARRRACVALALLALAACAVVSRRQVEVWRNTETLFLHAAAVTEGNFLAEHSIGSELLLRGEPALAQAHFVEALRSRERWADAHFGLADSLVEQGRYDEAIRSYERGLRIAPQSARGQLRLARALLASGQDAEAFGRARHAVALARPHERAFALVVLGAVLVERDALAEAVRAYERAISSRPDLAEAHAGLGVAQLARGKPDAAYASLRRAEALGGGGPALWLALGDAERALGRENEARLHFDAVQREAQRMQDSVLAAEVARPAGRFALEKRLLARRCGRRLGAGRIVEARVVDPGAHRVRDEAGVSGRLEQRAQRGDLVKRRIEPGRVGRRGQHDRHAVVDGTQVRRGVILREAMKGVLPESILNRPKMGFPVPFAGWMRTGWNQVAREVLLDRRSRERG